MYNDLKFHNGKIIKKINMQRQWEEKKNLMVVETPHLEMKFHIIELHHSH
jgi:hypothetical protein